MTVSQLQAIDFFDLERVLSDRLHRSLGVANPPRLISRETNGFAFRQLASSSPRLRSVLVVDLEESTGVVFDVHAPTLKCDVEKLMDIALQALCGGSLDGLAEAGPSLIQQLLGTRCASHRLYRESCPDCRIQDWLRGAELFATADATTPAITTSCSFSADGRTATCILTRIDNQRHYVFETPAPQIDLGGPDKQSIETFDRQVTAELNQLAQLPH